MQRIEGVKKFFLGTFFSSNELNIIQQQNIYRSVFASKRLGSVLAYGMDHVVGEFFRCNVQHLFTAFDTSISNGM